MARAQGMVSVVWMPSGMAAPPRYLTIPAYCWLRTGRYPNTNMAVPFGPDGRQLFDSDFMAVCWFRTIRDVVIDAGVMAAVAVEAMQDGTIGNLANRTPLVFDNGWLATLNQDFQINSFGGFTGGVDLPDLNARIEALANDIRVNPMTMQLMTDDVNAMLAMDARTPAHLKFPVDGSIEPVGPPGAPGRQWVRSEMERIMDRDRRINERIVANRANVNINLGNNSVMYTHGTDYLVSDDSVVFRHPPSRGDAIIFDEAIEMMQTPAGKKPLVHVAERVIRPPTMRELWLD